MVNDSPYQGHTPYLLESSWCPCWFVMEANSVFGLVKSEGFGWVNPWQNKSEVCFIREALRNGEQKSNGHPRKCFAPLCPKKGL